jgi:hypothetical protein
LQAVVSRRGTTSKLARPRCRTLPVDSTSGGARLGSDRDSRVEVGDDRLHSGHDDRRTRRRLVAWPPGETRPHWNALQPRLAGQDERDPMDARGGQPCRMERREAPRPPRYNHLHLGGPVRAHQAGISSIQASTPARLPARDHFTRGGRPRRRHRSPHSRSGSSHAPSPPHVSQLRCWSPRPPKPNAPGCDLDPQERYPTRAAAHETPAPSSLGPANVSGFSCEAERSEVSSAASRS